MKKITYDRTTAGVMRPSPSGYAPNSHNSSCNLFYSKSDTQQSLWKTADNYVSGQFFFRGGGQDGILLCTIQSFGGTGSKCHCCNRLATFVIHYFISKVTHTTVFMESSRQPRRQADFFGEGVKTVYFFVQLRHLGGHGRSVIAAISQQHLSFIP